VKPTDGDRDPAFDRLVAGGLAREIDASGNACPDADLLAAWFDHTLSAVESERIESHASGCACCQQILAALARSEPVVVRAAPVPEPARPWHWHWRWVVPLATAVLVVMVGTRTLRAPGPVMMVPTPPSTAGPATQVQMTAPPPAPQPPRSRPPDFGASGARARAEPAPTAGLAAGAPSGAMATDLPAAEMAKRQADNATDKMLKAASPQPAAPAMPEPVTVGGRAVRPAPGTLNVRQTSVTTPTLAGSAIAWRFGQDGAIEKSSDRGQTWERQSSGVTTALADASAPTDRVCWIVGAHGVVLRTTDGRTWQRLNSPTEADIVAVHAWSESSATITASDRSVYETTDGGQSWRRR
jgi:hypothetical protein